MNKTRNEVRDPIHGFICFDNRERAIINSRPFQRLKHIHQLAMTYNVYPGATHKRFEHSLGVMETASRIYKTITDSRLIPDCVLPYVKEQVSNAQQRDYWLQVVRVAALLHDICHLPFSHAGEGLLPEEISHETLSEKMVGECVEILNALGDSPPANVDDVINIAFKHKRKTSGLKPWIALLNEMITGDIGADRIDYLLRDSLHLGVAYGRFDSDRLIDNFRLAVDENEKLTLAVEYGGLHAAEGLLLARYWMFTQVYYHPVRIAYDLHLADYLKVALPECPYWGTWQQAIEWDDIKVLQLLYDHYHSEDKAISGLAERIFLRQHFKKAFDVNTQHGIDDPQLLEVLYEKLITEYEPEKVFKYPDTNPKEASPASPLNINIIKERTGEVFDILMESKVVATIPPIEIGFILASPDIRDSCSQKIDSMIKSMMKDGGNPR